MFITITRDVLYRIGAAAGVCVLLAALFFVLPQSEPSAAQTGAEAQPAASISDWGLSFQTNGQPPVGNVSAGELAQYGAYYLGGTDKKTIYLTFDAGYENGCTPAILDALKAHNAPACFFVVGNYIDTAPELVQRMVDEGHIVGNHTLHHPDMSTIADKEAFAAELTGLEEKFTALTGQPFRRLYCRMLDELAQEWSLSRTEAEVMFLLSCDKTLDTARDICETQLLKKSAVSRAAEGLVRRGWLEALPDPRDRRIQHLRLLSPARPFSEEVRRAGEAFFCLLLQDVTLEEQQQMEKIAQKIEHNVRTVLSQSDSIPHILMKKDGKPL